jgi:hypothetical protein
MSDSSSDDEFLRKCTGKSISSKDAPSVVSRYGRVRTQTKNSVYQSEAVQTSTSSKMDEVLKNLRKRKRERENERENKKAIEQVAVFCFASVVFPF